MDKKELIIKLNLKLALFLFSTNICLLSAHEKYSSIRVWGPDLEKIQIIQEIGIPLDHSTFRPGAYIQFIVTEKENKLCQGKINAYESHNYEISQLGNHLQGLASSQSCKYEIIRHINHDIFGTQFLPEMSDDGKSIIQNFLLV